MNTLIKTGRCLENIISHIKNNHPNDMWVLGTVEPMFIEGIQSYVSIEEEQLMVKKLNQLLDTYEFRFGSIFESLTEGLSPEVSNKAKAIFKSMIADKRDVLFKRYGVEAEKVAYGRAIAKAKQEMENKTTQNEEKLREMVRTALSTPIDSTSYMDERMALSEDDWQQPDDESSMAKTQLQTLIRDAQNLEYMIQDNEQLDAWVQSKITKAQDYIASVYNYMKGEAEQDKQIMSSPLAERIFNRIKNRM